MGHFGTAGQELGNRCSTQTGDLVLRPSGIRDAPSTVEVVCYCAPTILEAIRVDGLAPGDAA
jgi:hypothetical protein